MSGQNKGVSRQKHSVSRLKTALVIMMVLGMITFAAFKLSPWPPVWIIRYAFQKGTHALAVTNRPYLPNNVDSIKNVTYRQGDADAKLDIFWPNDDSSRSLPVIVWVHGGAWISGQKEDVGDFLKILASKGFVTVALGYSVAPGKTYPTPLVQVSSALKFLSENSSRFGFDSSRILLGGDSGGAQIAAQVANIITSPEYSELVGVNASINPQHLAGLILYCGAYDLAEVDLNGHFGWFLKTVLWSYTGKSEARQNEAIRLASVTNYITKDFPPFYITAGNKDPLENHSRGLTARALKIGIMGVDTLFYPKNHEPPLPHEYQFDMSLEDARTSLDRTVSFIRRVAYPTFGAKPPTS